MPRSLALGALAALAAFVACGTEEDHEHDAEDFANKAECEEHYAEEGHSEDEIAELCADVAA